jgi:uncharacterized protein YciI
MHFVLLYELAPDYLERRPQFRNQHLAMAWAAHERGELLLAGALGDPLDGALLLFGGESQAAAEAFARSDPYVVNGLVKHWRVRPWITVVGQGAGMPP